MKNLEHRKLFFGILLFSLLTFIGSFIISVDSFIIASNPDVILGCDFSKNISCTTVAESWQAQVLGFPNAFLGLMFEPVLIFLSIIYLTGSKIKNWIMAIINVLSLISLLFALWLFIQSAFIIQVLCPWCLLVCISTILYVSLLFRFNSLDNFFGKSFYKLSEVYFEYAVAILLICFVAGTVLFKYFLI